MLTNKCSLSKRISAFLIDFLIILLSSFVLKLGICFPIANNCFSFADNQKTLAYEKINSNLFVYVDSNFELVVDSTSSEEVIKEAYSNNRYRLVNINDFVSNNESVGSDIYISYLDKFYSLLESDNFNSLKSKSDLFVNIDSNLFKDDVDENERINFCNLVLKQADSDIFMYKDGIINMLQANVYLVDLLVNIIPFFVACLIFVFIIPLTSKNRSSLGKKLMKLGVTNKYYVPCNALLMTTRFLSFMLLEVLLSMFLIGIPLLISLLMALYLKNGQCIHDFLSTTLVIDLEEFTPFKSIEEYAEFIKEEKDARDRSLRRPYEN